MRESRPDVPNTARPEGDPHQVGRGGLLLHGGKAGERVVLADGAHGAPLALLLLRDLPEALVLLVLAGVLPVEAAQGSRTLRSHNCPSPSPSEALVLLVPAGVLPWKLHRAAANSGQ